MAVLKRLLVYPIMGYLFLTVLRWRFQHATGYALIWLGLKCQRWLPPEFSHHAFIAVLSWYLWRPAWVTDALVTEAQARRAAKSIAD